MNLFKNIIYNFVIRMRGKLLLNNYSPQFCKKLIHLKLCLPTYEEIFYILFLGLFTSVKCGHPIKPINHNYKNKQMIHNNKENSAQ